MTALDPQQAGVMTPDFATDRSASPVRALERYEGRRDGPHGPEGLIPAAGQLPPSSGRAHRAVLAREIAALHGGVAHRSQLRAVGVSRDAVRTEVRAGRWAVAGRHTVVIEGREPQGEGRWWWAVWESGAGARLTGASALESAGMTGFTPSCLDVEVPADNTAYRHEGVRLHRPRSCAPIVGAGLPRVPLETATICGAQWAVSDRQAALLICLPVQQRMVPPERLLAHWRSIGRSARRALIGQVVSDVCDGAHSLHELDFGGLCTRYGLPAPSRQVVHQSRSGRIYVDAEWTRIGLVVEIDGGHHAAALNPIDDAIRQNELMLRERSVLRIPVLGLRFEEQAFMRQVVQAHVLCAARAPRRG